MWRIFILIVLMYIVASLILSLRHDIHLRSSVANESLRLEISRCQHRYAINRCDQSRVPAIESLCLELETCMNREPEQVSSKVAMRMLGESINELFDALSWKSIIGMAIGGVILVVGSEFVLKRFNFKTI